MMVQFCSCYVHSKIDERTYCIQMQVSQKTSQMNEGCAPGSPSPHSSKPPGAAATLDPWSHQRPPTEAPIRDGSRTPRRWNTHCYERLILCTSEFRSTTILHLPWAMAMSIDLLLFRVPCRRRRRSRSRSTRRPLVTASGSASGSAAAGRGTPRGSTRARARPRIGTT